MTGLARLAPVGLDELIEVAGLQTRIDRKYALSTGDLAMVVDLLPTGTRVLDIAGSRGFGYASVYFDTPELLSYHQAAYRRRRRFKVRTRTYLSSGEEVLEVKTRTGEATVKERLPGRHTQDGHLTPVGADFVCRALASAGIDTSPVGHLAPVLTTAYSRSTLLLPEAAGRVTVDTDLTWVDAAGPTLTRPELAIIETKAARQATDVDRLLWSLGIRPARVSKFATGLATLRPTLPANRWARTQRRFFASAGLPNFC